MNEFISADSVSNRLLCVCEPLRVFRHVLVLGRLIAKAGQFDAGVMPANPHSQGEFRSVLNSERACRGEVCLSAALFSWRVEESRHVSQLGLLRASCHLGWSHGTRPRSRPASKKSSAGLRRKSGRRIRGLPCWKESSCNWGGEENKVLWHLSRLQHNFGTMGLFV